MGTPVDVFHHEVRLAGFRDAAIDQTRHGDMFEIGEELTLGHEGGHEALVREAHVHHLDGHALAELIVGTVRLVHRGHAAARDQAVDLVVAKAQANAAVLLRLRRRELAVRLEQRMHFRGDRIVAGERAQSCVPLRSGVVALDRME